MKYRLVLAFAATAVTASLLYAHELFIKLDSYFLPPNATATVRVLNGTFAKSENWLTRDRLADISAASEGNRSRLDTTRWGPSSDSLTSLLTWSTGEPATYVLGVSTKARELHLEAKDFNQYLASEGIPDVLEARKRDGEMDQPARERYSKHVKAVVQVGDRRTGGFDLVLGYPAEIVPLSNPYGLSVGSELRVRCLVDGRPVANQLVIAGGEGATGPIAERSTRTDQDGVAAIRLDAAGKWYVKFINMVKAERGNVDYVSKWATLTFELR
jgi:hypothetical protein